MFFFIFADGMRKPSTYLRSVMILMWMALQALISSATVLETGVHEYCPWEHFNASCPAGGLIVMNSAHYGRMRLGRCIDTDFQIGCMADVLPVLDGRCSGRPTCVIPLPDQTLQHQQPCKKDMLAYLEASYSCITVSGAEQKTCLETGSIRLDQTEGYLASYLAQTIGHGTSTCPWIIVGQPGQRIKLSVLDFSVNSRYRSEPETHGMTGHHPHSGGQNIVADYCQTYVTVSEERRSKRVQICSESSREQTIYTSSTHRIAVEVTDTAIVIDQPISFIIRFTVFGCADPVSPRNAWMERSGDRITVRCNDSRQSWHLVCKETNWIGQTGECQDPGFPYGDKVVDDSTFPTYGLAIAVIVGIFVGAFCGFILLAVVLWCRRRTAIPSSPRYGHNIELVATPAEPAEHICKVHRMPTSDYGYTHVWELRNTQLPMSVTSLQEGSNRGGENVFASYPVYKPGAEMASCLQEEQRLAVDARTGRLVDRTYECPIFDERFLNRVHTTSFAHRCPAASNAQFQRQSSQFQQCPNGTHFPPDLQLGLRLIRSCSPPAVAAENSRNKETVTTSTASDDFRLSSPAISPGEGFEGGGKGGDGLAAEEEKNSRSPSAIHKGGGRGGGGGGGRQNNNFTLFVPPNDQQTTPSPSSDQILVKLNPIKVENHYL